VVRPRIYFDTNPSDRAHYVVAVAVPLADRVALATRVGRRRAIDRPYRRNGMGRSAASRRRDQIRVRSVDRYWMEDV